MAALPEIPFWPQLPRRSPLEGMTLQYLDGFPGAGDATSAAVDTGPGSLDALQAFYERVLARDTASFALAPERAPGFYALEERLVQSPPAGLVYVKGHVTGPVTLASALKDPEGRELLHDDAFCEAVGAWVAERARWQAERLARIGKPVIVFLDEPVMEVYGSAYSSLSASLVRGLWEPCLAAVAGAGALSGIHCCGNTDWGLLFACGADIVNFDAHAYLEKMLLYPAEADAFLARGGALAWGVVPTSDAARALGADAILGRLEAAVGRFAEAGVAEDRLWTQCLLTPACGMGSLDPDLAAHILALLAAVSRRVRRGPAA